MKNLKRILSLALASVMVVGMMVVGASAAYPDEAQISAEFKSAISILDALNIMNGNPDGTINPKGTLTRAEMATMISTVLNRGTAPNYATKTTPSFTDIKGHWGEAFVEYAYSVKVMNGVSTGSNARFAPDGTLTATTAARSILNAMGYTIDDPSNWELLTEVQARQEELDLYAGLDDIADPSHTFITREQFAQMMNNALTKPMTGNNTYKTTANVYGTVYGIKVVASTDGGSITDSEDIEYLEGETFLSAADAKAVADSYGAIKDDYTITTDANGVVGTKEVDTPETLGHKFLGMKTYKGVMTSVKYDEDDEVYTTTVGLLPDFYADEDFSALMGQNVQVVVRESNGIITKVYGITANAGSVLFTGTIGDIAPMTGTTIAANAKSIKVNGKEYKIDDKNAVTGATITSPAGGVNLYAYNTTSGTALTSYAAATSSAPAGFSGISNACTMKGIDTNGDGKLDRIEYLPVEVVTVTNVTAKAITTNPKVAGETSAVLSTEADTLAVKAYEGVKKGDVVLATPKANTVSDKVELVKAEIVEGVAADAARSATKEVRIDGKWTKVLAAADYTALAGLSTTTKYDVVMVNGYIAKATAQSGATASKDMLIVTAIASGANLDGETEFRAVLMDGTTVTGYAKGLTKDTNEHTVYTYTVKDGNKYTLKAVTASNTAGYDSVIAQAPGFTPAVTTAGSEAPAKIAGLPIADDAVIVVRHDSNALASDAENTTENTTNFGPAKALRLTSVLTGAEVKKWATALNGADNGSSNGNKTSNVVFTETVNGITYVKAAILFTAKTKLPNQGAIGQNIGYVVSDAYAIADYMVYDIWDGEDTITVKDENDTAPTKGTVIKYADKGDGVIDTSESGMGVVTTVDAAVVGYDKGNLSVVTTAAAPNALVVDEKTVILYVDAANKAGQATGSIVNATEDGATPGQYIANVTYKLGTAYSGKHVDILVVDVNNNILNADASNVNYTKNVTVAANTQVKDSNNHFELVSVTYNGVTYEIGTGAEALALDVKVGGSFTATLKVLDANSSAVKVQVGGADVGEKDAPSSAYEVDQTITVKCTINTQTGAITLAGTTA